MILKEWSEAQDIYQATMARFSKALRAILNPRKIKLYWYVWAALLALLALLFLYIFMDQLLLIGQNTLNWLTVLTLPLLFLFGLCLYGAIEKAWAKEFAADYATHGISHYPFWTRGTYFIYTLFLQELKDRKYSHKQVEELSSFAEIATPPEGPQFRLTQHPLFVYSMAVVIALVVNTIINSPLWQADTKAFTLSRSIMVLGFVIELLYIWHLGVRTLGGRHQTIQRYLKWAERDLKEEQPF